MVSARPSPNQVEGNLRVHGRNPRQPSPEDLLAQLSYPSSNDLLQDALAQVQGPYQAQLDNLARQEAKVRGDQKRGDRELAAMYGALQKSIKGDERGIRGNYDGAANTIRGNTAAGVNAVNKTYSDSNKELAGLFSQLGIGAAFGDATSGSQADRGLLAGLMNVRGNSAQQSLATDKAAAIQFNTSQAHSAGLAGNNRRADLVRQLNDTLSGIGDKRNETMGAMSSAIASRQYQLEQDAVNRQQELMRMMGDSGGAGGSGGSSAVGLTPAQEYAQMGPDEKGYYKASQLFGGNAGYAMQLVSGVANNQNGGIYQNIAHFIRSVLAENQKQQAGGRPQLSPTELQALASYFWDEGGTGRRPDREAY